MSILAFGGEMGFFIPSDANAVEGTVGGRFDSAFARGYSKTNGDACYLESATISTTADFWLHCEINQHGTGASSSTLKQIVVFYDGGGTAFARLTTGASGSGGAVTWQMEYLSGGVWTGVGSFSADPTTTQVCDFHIVSNTASGSIDMYISGTKRIGSGTINLSGYAGVAKVRCWGHTVVTSQEIYFSQVIMASESTIGWRLGTIAMTGQGSTHTFDVGGFANIDEAVYSDADEISSGTANQIELFTGTPVPSFTGYTIRAVGVFARAKKSGAGPAQMQLALRSAGTTYFSATKALDFGFGAIGNVWETNPATSAAFQPSEIAALEYGVKSIT